jgi:hypothetical protein
MTRFGAFTALSNPGLYVCREGTNSDVYLRAITDATFGESVRTAPIRSAGRRLVPLVESRA